MTKETYIYFKRDVYIYSKRDLLVYLVVAVHVQPAALH